MKLRRGVVMRPGVSKIEGERGLRIVSWIGADTRRGTAKRPPPVGADGKAHPRFTIGIRDRDAGGIAPDRERRDGNPRQFELSGARFDRGDKISVFDIVAEGLKSNFRRVKKGLRRTEKPRRVVDNTKLFEGRRVRKAGFARTQGFKRGDGTGKQRRGAVIWFRPWRDQERIDAG